MRQHILNSLQEPHCTVLIIPNEVGHLEREGTPDEESVGGVPTSVLQPASEPQGSCQEYYQKFALFAQFLFPLMTYELLSYSVRLHCANIHTPLPFLSYLYDFQTMKTRHPDLF